MKRCIKWVSITLVFAFVSLFSLIFFPAPPLLRDIDFSRAAYDSHHHLLRLTLSEDGQYRLYTPLSSLPPALIEAALLQEDRFFYWHPGINPFSLVNAIWKTYLHGARRMGGSTLTMQVARLRFKIHSKTVWGKCEQILRAVQLSFYYSKTELLEAYFNLAPYGHNIEGIGAASLIYFGKAAKELNLPESLTLVVIPQNPRQRANDEVVLQHMRNKLYQRWLIKHPKDLSLQALMNLPMQLSSRERIPYYAPHFVNEVLKRMPTKQHEIDTTLDLALQQRLLALTKEYLARYANLGVKNAAVMVVDTRDMGVKVLLGSADFFNLKIAGQIDGTMMRRSPGSTLKPFIYALALDQGLIHPATMLKDVPRSFGSYDPENFDHDFKGPIKAKEALRLSRNIPALDLAAELHQPSLYDLLKLVGTTQLKAEKYYGLSLALGGAEMSMQELVKLYAALQNDGLYYPLHFTSNDNKNISGKYLFSPEASFLVLEMLRDQGVSYKTGTSSSYRDAWTIGVAGPYVMAVWIGNFNGQGNPAFIGKERAAPLFFTLLPALQLTPKELASARKNPSNLHLTEVAVCKASGMLPGPYCKDTEKVWFIPGKSPIKVDNIHREIAINSRTHLRTCKIDKNTRFEIAEFWPSDLLALFKRARVERAIPPPYDTTCNLPTRAAKGFVPEIISPKAHIHYVVRLNGGPTLVPLLALVDADVHNLYWFLNTTYLGKVERDKPLIWQAKPGKYWLRAVDDAGRAGARELRVDVEK